MITASGPQAKDLGNLLQLTEFVGPIEQITEGALVLKCSNTISIPLDAINISPDSKWFKILRIGNIIGVLVLDDEHNIRIRLIRAQVRGSAMSYDTMSVIRKNIKISTENLIDMADEPVIKINSSLHPFCLPNGVGLLPAPPQLLPPSEIAAEILRLSRAATKLLDMPVDFGNAFANPLGITGLVPIGQQIDYHVMTIMKENTG